MQQRLPFLGQYSIGTAGQYSIGTNTIGAGPDYTGVPSVAFSVPPIAAIGLSEAEAHKRGLRFRTNYRRVPDWYTAVRVAEPVYGLQDARRGDSDQVLGAHLVGPHADEVINLFALALRND